MLLAEVGYVLLELRQGQHFIAGVTYGHITICIALFAIFVIIIIFGAILAFDDKPSALARSLVRRRRHLLVPVIEGGFLLILRSVLPVREEHLLEQVQLPVVISLLLLCHFCYD